MSEFSKGLAGIVAGQTAVAIIDESVDLPAPFTPNKLRTSP